MCQAKFDQQTEPVQVGIKSYYKELTHTVVGAEQASPNSIGWTNQEGRPQFLGMAEDSVRDTVSSAAAALGPFR